MCGVRQLSASNRWRNYARCKTGQFSVPKEQSADLEMNKNDLKKQVHQKQLLVPVHALPFFLGHVDRDL